MKFRSTKIVDFKSELIKKSQIYTQNSLPKESVQVGWLACFRKSRCLYLFIWVHQIHHVLASDVIDLQNFSLSPLFQGVCVISALVRQRSTSVLNLIVHSNRLRRIHFWCALVEILFYRSNAAAWK